MIPIKNIRVKNEDLPKLREDVKKLSNKEIRRFVVDGHNGKDYWHNEINEVALPGISQMEDFEVIKYLKEICMKDGYQIYAIVVVYGNYTIEEFGKMAPDVLAKLMRPIYYDFSEEPLDSFRNTLK